MQEQPVLSEQEWQMVAQLLEQERENLHPEIRRTRTPDMHEELQSRLKSVESMLERVRRAAPMA